MPTKTRVFIDAVAAALRPCDDYAAARRDPFAPAAQGQR
jgi:hypothetical protein